MKIKKMTREEKNTEVAKILGATLWTENYVGDLNSINEAWKDYFGFYSEGWLAAHKDLKKVVAEHLGEEDSECPYLESAVANASAELRVDAFLRAVNS